MSFVEASVVDKRYFPASEDKMELYTISFTTASGTLLKFYARTGTEGQRKRLQQALMSLGAEEFDAIKPDTPCLLQVGENDSGNSEVNFVMNRDKETRTKIKRTLYGK